MPGIKPGIIARGDLRVRQPFRVFWEAPLNPQKAAHIPASAEETAEKILALPLQELHLTVPEEHDPTVLESLVDKILTGNEQLRLILRKAISRKSVPFAQAFAGYARVAVCLHSAPVKELLESNLTHVAATARFCGDLRVVLTVSSSQLQDAAKLLQAYCLMGKQHGLRYTISLRFVNEPGRNPEQEEELKKLAENASFLAGASVWESPGPWRILESGEQIADNAQPEPDPAPLWCAPWANSLSINQYGQYRYCPAQTWSERCFWKDWPFAPDKLRVIRCGSPRCDPDRNSRAPRFMNPALGEAWAGHFRGLSGR